LHRRTAADYREAAKESNCIAVVSAMSGVTNRLIEAAKKAQTGNTGEAAALVMRCGSNTKLRWPS